MITYFIILNGCVSSTDISIPIQNGIVPSYVAANEKYIYFAQIDDSGSYLGRMNLSSKEIQIHDIGLSTDSAICRIAVDADGNVFVIIENGLLGAEKSFEIWEIKDDLSVDAKINISSSISVQEFTGISSFCIDGMGKFYIREYIADDTIVLNKAGEEVWRIKDVSQKEYFEGIGRSRDGRVCAVFSKMLGDRIGQKIVLYNNESSEVSQSFEGIFIPGEDIYSVVGSDMDSDVLMKGNMGVYRFSIEEEDAKFLLDLSKYVTSEMGTSTCFLTDGRLCLITVQVHISEEVQIGDTNMYLINLDNE